MALNPTSEVRAAEDLAAQAEALTGKLKAGAWESVQALALVSIAKSLTVIASRSDADSKTQG